jgi:hypothetical protein
MQPRRVGNGAGTALNTSERLSFAFAHQQHQQNLTISGGQGARKAFLRYKAVPAPLPTLQARNSIKQSGNAGDY